MRFHSRANDQGKAQPDEDLARLVIAGIECAVKAQGTIMDAYRSTAHELVLTKE
jgi:hypothetical protein